MATENQEKQDALPATHRALVLTSTREPLDMAVVERPTPQATPGAAVVRILAAGGTQFNYFHFPPLLHPYLLPPSSA